MRNSKSETVSDLVMSDDFVFIDLKLDWSFKYMFGSKGCEDNLLVLLDSILPEKHITSVELSTQEQMGDRKDSKKVVYDISCTSPQGDFVVEMQYAPKDDFGDRMIYYSGFPIRDQVRRSDSSYRFNDVYMIGILNFEINRGKEAITHYSIRSEENPQELLSKHLHYVTVELPKLPKELSENPERGEGMLYLLANQENLKEIPESLKSRGLENIIEKSILASMDNLTREEYFAIYKKEKDRRCEMATAIRMGRDEGRIEDARNLKALGVSAEIIEKATGLTREQIEAL